MSAACEFESSSRRGATVSASVGLEGGGGGSEGTVGAVPHRVHNHVRLFVAAREQRGDHAPGDEKHGYCSTAIQRERRPPAAGRVGGGSTGDGDSTPGSTRSVADVSDAAWPRTYLRRQRRAAAPAVLRARGFLGSAARTHQRLRGVHGGVGDRLLGRRDGAPQFPQNSDASGSSLPQLPQVDMRQAWPQLVQKRPSGRRSAPQFSQ